MQREMETAESIVELLRSRGLRMTPQRRAIVSEVMSTEGHISPAGLARQVAQRVPGVSPSTIYRTLEMLEELGVLSHAHLEGGAEYHRRSLGEHVHLACSRCGREESLSGAEAERLRRMLQRSHGFRADLAHFAISGLCATCQREEAVPSASGPRGRVRAAG
jgi:Fur family ferric uptake transcriptional regulator